MEVEWDAAKAKANRSKHGVDFADAATVFHDELALTVAEDNLDEARFVTLGVDAIGRLLAVVYALRGDALRIISARRATKRERYEYED